MVRTYSGGDDVSELSSVINSMLDIVSPVPYAVHEDGEKQSSTSWWRCQTTVALMGFLGITVAYTTRVSLSIAIVAMVGKRNTTHSSTSLNESDVCPLPEEGKVMSESMEGDFDWDPQIQGIVLASFFYGYMATSFLGGRAAEYYGGRIVFGVGVILTSFLNLISPFCAYLSKEALMANRILQGMAQGLIFPSITTLMATWATPKERGRLVTQVYIGVQAGTILGMSLGGWLCTMQSMGGWPLVFYVFGGFGLLWGIPWFLLIHDRPELHPRISVEELRHLQQCKSSLKSTEIVSIPWKALLKSASFWAIAMMYFSNGYGFYTLLTGLPTYFSDIQHFDLNQNGLTSALPYLVMWGVSVCFGYLMNWMTLNDNITIRRVRMLSTAVGSYGPASCMVAMCFVGCNSNLALVIICLGVGLNGTCYSGYCSSTQDIAPNLAGTLLGICNTLGALSGSVAPMIMGAVINNNQTLGSWRIVFLIPACLWVLSSTLYIIFITAEVQIWNEPQAKKKLFQQNGDIKEYDVVKDIDP